ncbi:Alpha-tubulin suppressor [Paenibacillus tianmuensis]|uniref:Alpha-tubulin suppressor n=1 Tax=Paenibacillus tianmuensis TaxID=624147 RepID=A0A1G4TKP5_9BACL|nr:carboxypeptidase regulatory-like domain-containing protein [Paenibacillus tianmuensis]SCW82000.1 Alpha-tubulin suppressor [Paenibacillus tianmuensis]
MYRVLKRFRFTILQLSMLLMAMLFISNFAYASTDSTSNSKSKFIHVTADSGRSYAVKADGTVWGWGYGLNDKGEMVGYPSFAKSPVKIPSLNKITKVVGGSNSFQLALRSDGTVWSWGNNAEGQLGDGTNIYKSTPTQVVGLHDVISISAGSHHSLALKSDGTVWTWGLNSGGELGDGTTVTRFTPVQVKELSDVTAIAGGYGDSRAVRSDGTLWEWGGYSIDGYQTTPKQIWGIENVKAIANAPDFITLALKSDGTVWYWRNHVPKPSQIPNLNNIVAISNGVALKADGTVLSVRDNMIFGELIITPITINDVVFISGTNSFPHSLAIKKDGTVWAWGSNDSGQLGDGTLEYKTNPVQVSFPNDDQPISRLVTGSVYGIEGMPVEYATVTASTYNESWTVTTDTYGKYALSVPTGTYNMKVFANGYRESTKSNVNGTSNVYQTVDFNLAGYGGFIKLALKDSSGKPLSNPYVSIKKTDNSFSYSGLVYGKTEWVHPLSVGNYDVTIGDVTRRNIGVELNKLYVFDPSIPAPTPSVIQGKVSGVEGLPVEHATVTASTSNQSWTVTTDVYGKYTLSVPSGVYTMKVFANGYMESSKSNVTVSSSVYEAVDFNLAGYGGFVKLVFKDSSGKPLKNPFVSIKKTDSNFSYSGAVFGKTEWVYPLSAGTYDVTIGDATRRNFKVELNKLSVFDPSIFAVIQGKVQGIEGLPVEYATVTASAYNQSWTVTTDVYGKYALSVPSGIYTLKASANGYMESWKSNISVTSSVYETVDFNLAGSGGFIKLVFKDGKGSPLTNPFVSIKKSDNSLIYSGEVYGKTEWVYPLSVGNYDVTIGDVTRRNIKIELNKLSVFDPSIFGVIQGKVHGIEGLPVQYATVTASTYNQSWTVTTDIYGRYALSVPSGIYTLKASANGYMESWKSNVSVTSSVYETADFNLAGSGGFIKLVMKDTNGKPLLYPFVSIKKTDNTFSYSTAIYGKNEWVYPLSVGTYDVTIDNVTRHNISIEHNRLSVFDPSISGPITNIIQGKISGVEGLPVEYATVTASTYNQSWTVTTDLYGRYALSLPSGIYTLKASAISYVESWKSNVNVTSNVYETVDFNLVGSGGFIKLVFKDTNGKPLPNAFVSIKKTDGSGFSLGSYGKSEWVYPLSVGNYDVTIGDVTRRNINIETNKLYVFDPSIPVPTTSVIQGKISGVEGLPVEYATVTASTYNQSWTVTTDVYGKYTLSVPSGIYALKASANGYVQNWKFNISVTSSVYEAVDFNLVGIDGFIKLVLKDTNGKPLPNAVVSIKKTDNGSGFSTGFYGKSEWISPLSVGNYDVTIGNFTRRNISIEHNRLTVFDPSIFGPTTNIIQGKISGVERLPVEYATVTASTYNQSWTVTTDVYGRYELSLPSGIYTLKASANGYVESWKSNISVTSSVYEAVDFNLVGSGGFIKLVFKDTNGKPLPNAFVSIKNTNGFSGFSTRVYGKSEWVYPLSVGNYDVTIGDVTRRNISIEHNKLYVFDPSIPVPTTSVIQGKISGIEGLPVEYATVTASTYNKSWTVTTDVYGKYTLTVPSGIYTLNVFANGYMKGSKSNVNVTSNVYETVDLNLVGYGGFAKFVFKDSNGKPLTNPFVSIKKTDNSFSYSGIVYGKNEWVYPLSAGNYDVTIGDVTRRNIKFELNKLSVFDPSIPVPTTRVIQGKIRGVEGLPVEHATVIASTYNKSWIVTTDAYGKYALSVPSGIYTLKVFANGYVENSKSNVSVTSSVYETFDFNLAGYGGFIKLVFKDSNDKPLTNPFVSIKKTDNSFSYSGVVYGKTEWLYPLSEGIYDVTIGDVTRRNIKVELDKLSIFNPAD